MISCRCSSNRVNVCSTSRANLSDFNSLRVILATKTSGVFGKYMVSRSPRFPPASGPPAILIPMYLKILAHPVFPALNFHMPMIVDLSHPLIMLQGENGSGKSTLLNSIHYALRGETVEGYIYRLEVGDLKLGRSYLFDAEQHNPRTQLELFKDDP